MLNGIYDKEVCLFLPKHSDVAQNRSTRGHTKKLFKRHSKLDITKYSFGHRIINPWNSLTESIVSAPTLNTFKNRLDKYWNHINIKYDFEATLKLIYQTGIDQDASIEV